MTEKTKVRIAPSPTGYLHVGNIRTALVNYLFAKKTGGHFMLRLDDTDRERSKPEYEDAIREDMRWLGLDWDSEARQWDRMERYDAAKQKLIASGRLYACYETAEELEIRRKLQVSRGKPPIYDRAALQLTDAQKKEYEQQGRKAHWRFLLKDETIAWDDLVRGHVEFHGNHVSDPVLVREDGVPLYTLSSVVDDGEMAMTHVIRGEDHVSNTAVQVQIFAALGFPVPKFAHMALLTMKEGKLSKREGGGDVRSLRAKGILPLAINSYLAKIGTSDSVELAENMEALVASFNFSKLGRAAAHYDEEELLRLNAKLLHTLSFEEAKEALKVIRHPDPERSEGEGSHAIAQGPSPSAQDDGKMDENFWLAVRENLHTLAEAKDWWEILNEHINPITEEDRIYLRESLSYLKEIEPLLPPEPWDSNTWNKWIEFIKDKTDRKGKALFMPIRLALTGKSSGPELNKLLPILGKDKVIVRLFGHYLENYP